VTFERHIMRLLARLGLLELQAALTPEPIRWDWPSFRSALVVDGEREGWV
jgi:hypothetical protein